MKKISHISSPCDKDQTIATEDSQFGGLYFISRKGTDKPVQSDAVNHKKRFNRTSNAHDIVPESQIQLTNDQYKPLLNRKSATSNRKSFISKEKKLLKHNRTCNNLQQTLSNTAQKFTDISNIKTQKSKLKKIRQSSGSMSTLKGNYPQALNQNWFNNLLLIEQNNFEIKSFASKSSSRDGMNSIQKRKSSLKNERRFSNLDEHFHKKDKFFMQNTIHKDYQQKIKLLKTELREKDEAHVKLSQELANTHSREQQLFQNLKKKIQQNHQLAIQLQRMHTIKSQMQIQFSRINKQAINKYQQSQKQRKIAIKQLNLFVDRKVPKNIKELQSVRQVYLEKNIIQLKRQLQKNKSENQQQMQAVISQLRNEIAQSKDEVKNLEFQIRMLNQKNDENSKCLSKYSYLKSELRKMKYEVKEADLECQKLRKQNQHIKSKLWKLQQKNKSKYRNSCQERNLLKVPSQTGSLALSLSIQG